MHGFVTSSLRLQIDLTANRAPALLLLVCGMLGCVADAPAASVRIEVQDNAAFHSFSPGEEFSISILATVTSGSESQVLAYQWQDYRGRSLGPNVPFATGAEITVLSPTATPVAGYYGLTFHSDDPDMSFSVTSSAYREIGFVVLPPSSASERRLAPDSPFGVVHANLDDPHLSTWIKTLTWNTVGAGEWHRELTHRRKRGLQELPMVYGDKWASDDNAAVSSEFLMALTDKIRPYFKADVANGHWELGIEENLRSRYLAPAYFANLKAKVAAVRAVADEFNPDMRFLFQIAETRVGDAEKFFESEAAAEFDILALHPYAWPDFPTPERWLDTYIDEIRSAMRKHGVDFPIWITEIGAPQNDARVSMMSSGNNPVRGQSRAENSAYLVKTHVLALARGIEKIFWYNYRDRDASTKDVEDHFGLVDFHGFPKPSYAAYATMVRCLKNTRFERRRDLSTGVRIYEFSTANRKCLVVWTYPASRLSVPLYEIVGGQISRDVVAITNTVGTPRQVSTDILVDEYPLFISIHADTGVTSD